VAPMPGTAKKPFQIAMAVELEGRHHVAGFHAQPGQSVRQPVDSFVKGAVGDAGLVAVDDLPIGE